MWRRRTHIIGVTTEYLIKSKRKVRKSYMKTYKPEGQLLTTAENKKALSSQSALREALFAGTVLEARVIRCDSGHNLYVDLGCMRGVIPRNEGAWGIETGEVRDIALISRVNKPVTFKIKDIRTDENSNAFAVLSRKEVQRECLDNYLGALMPGDVIPGCVSHIESFGVFCDIGAGISALMPIDSISVSRIPHPSARFVAGQSIYAAVKSVDELGRITLTHKELLGTWEQNAANVKVGETVPGIVRSVEKYGVFVELTPNLAGLAEYSGSIDAGSHAGVYVKNIIPEKMKIKLVIVDCFKADYPVQPPEYYITEGHLDRWVYSPAQSSKIIETRFG